MGLIKVKDRQIIIKNKLSHLIEVSMEYDGIIEKENITRVGMR